MAKKVIVKRNPVFNHQWTKEQEELLQQLLESKFERASAVDACRPTVLTPDLMERFFLAAQQGLPVELTCDYCFIDRQLFYSWRDWYKRLKKRVEPILWKVYKAQQENKQYKLTHFERASLRLTTEETMVIEFFDKLAMIKGQYALRLMTGLNVSAMKGNVSAGSWLLKQAFPDHFSDDVNDKPDDSNAVNTGFSYVEINAVDSDTTEKNITQDVTLQPTTIGGDTEIADSIQ